MTMLRTAKAMLLVIWLTFAGTAMSDSEVQPSGTVQIASKSVAAGIGVSWGNGTLHFKGSDYAFSLTGLSVADLGISSITTTGDVFNLGSPADLAGNYVAGAAGLAIAGGQDGIIMRNDHGVVLRLRGTEQGVRFQLGAQGVAIHILE